MNTKVLRNNLLGLLGYSILVHLAFRGSGGEEAALGSMMAMMFLVGGHTAVLFVIALVHFFSSRQPQGRSYLLASVLVLLIGFGLCWGGMALA